MNYNKKEQLLDKIKGLNLVNPDEYGDKYNKGVRHSLARTIAFFNKELVPEVPQYIADWYESNKENLDYNLWNYIMDWEDEEYIKFIKDGQKFALEIMEELFPEDYEEEENE